MEHAWVAPIPSPLQNPGVVAGLNMSDFAALLVHPLLRKDVLLATPPIAELVISLRRAVILREQGICYTAKSGYGKSKGLTIGEQELRRLFPDAPVFRHVINNHQVPSIRAFFKHFLKTVGERNLSGETYDLRLRLENALIDCGSSSSMKSVVLLIDEAQEMALQDFQFLKDIGNQLEEEGVQLVVIMMGQDPEFTAVITKLKLAGRLDLISRFTLRHILFRGLSTEADIEAVLNAIDRQEYPVGSGCTWPQAFVPIAWSQGFRIVHQTAKLVHVLKEHLPKQTLVNGVSARQFFLAIRRFLLDYADLELQGKALPDDLWDIAVEYALVADAAEIAAQDKRKHRARVRL